MTTETKMDEKKKERFIRIIRGLQKKSASTTYGEAMLCIGKAQELMELHGITSIMLAEPEEEDILAEIFTKSVYRFSDRKMPTWLLNLFGGVGWANRCRTWYSGGHVMGAGTEDNLIKMEIMLCWLIGEIDRLYKEEKPRWLTRGEGRSWANSFRLGAANEIAQRARQARRDAAKAARENTPEKMYAKALEEGDQEKLLEMDRKGIQTNPKYALARVNYAIARLDQDEKRARTHVDDTIVKECSKCKGKGWKGYDKKGEEKPCNKCDAKGKVSRFRSGSPRSHRGTVGAAFNAGKSAGGRASMNAPKGHIK